MITVVTGYSPEGYELYGKRAIESFGRFWPNSVNYVVYSEDVVPIPWGGCMSRWKPFGLREFIERHKDNPEYNGRKPRRGWERKHHRVGYNYRFDAVRFCWQMFYPEDAAKVLRNGDILTWLDGDVITVSEASTAPIEAALENHDIVHLGRESQSELGFWALRLNTDTRQFLQNIGDCYRSDAIFGLDQWHSGFVFDHFLAKYPGPVLDWTPGMHGNVWIKTPLARFSVHLKGRLKESFDIITASESKVGKRFKAVCES